jgi:hypothetical protein
MTTDTAYHDERFGSGSEITPARFRACADLEDGGTFFIGFELPCEPAQLLQFSELSPIRPMATHSSFQARFVPSE